MTTLSGVYYRPSIFYLELILDLIEALLTLTIMWVVNGQAINPLTWLLLLLLMISKLD